MVFEFESFLASAILWSVVILDQGVVSALTKCEDKDLEDKAKTEVKIHIKGHYPNIPTLTVDPETIPFDDDDVRICKFRIIIGDRGDECYMSFIIAIRANVVMDIVFNGCNLGESPIQRQPSLTPPRPRPPTPTGNGRKTTAAPPANKKGGRNSQVGNYGHGVRAGIKDLRKAVCRRRPNGNKKVTTSGPPPNGNQKQQRTRKMATFLKWFGFKKNANPRN